MNLEEYERMYAVEESQWWYAGMRAISGALLDGALPSASRPRILDAGCGTGLCGPLLRPLAARLVGVDLSEKMVELARDWYKREPQAAQNFINRQGWSEEVRRRVVN